MDMSMYNVREKYVPTPAPTTPLPEWLTIHEDRGNPQFLPRHPRTKTELELEQITFESVFEVILDRLIEGDAPKPIIDDDPRGISYGRFMRWVRKDPERVRRWEEAEEIGAEVLVGEMTAIADGDPNIPPEDVNRSKLRVDTRKWLLQVRNRRKYGDKQQLDITSTTTSISATLQLREERLAELLKPRLVASNGNIVEGEVITGELTDAA
jgi:hypothetical protein